MNTLDKVTVIMQWPLGTFVCTSAGIQFNLSLYIGLMAMIITFTCLRIVK
jgi:hypothetical protein